MKHKIWYDDETEILFLEFLDHFIYENLEPLQKKLYDLLEGKTHRQMLVIMTTQHKKQNPETSEGAKKIIQDAEISEIAFVGGNAANRMIAKVLMKTGAIKTKSNFFKDKKEAINWLKSKR
mgnify:CR=1 FL=1